MDIFSCYNLISSNEDKEVIIYNTLYRSVIKLNSEFGRFILEKESIVQLPSDLFCFLKKNKIIVEDTFEKQVLEKYVQQIKESKIYRFVFFTSLACNLRCDYCYETHEAKYLNGTSYQNVIDYISTLETSYLVFDWFGGEPLLALKAIEDFTAKIRKIKGDSDFMSSMTTNGTLLTKSIFHKCISLNVRKYQITVDGCKKDNDIHRKFQNGNGTYDLIMKNIEYMKSTNEDFDVTFRININRNTDIDSFLSQLDTIIGSDKRFQILLFPIADWGGCIDKQATLTKLEFLKLSNELFKKHPALNNCQYKQLISGFIMCNYRKKNTFVINPDGNITDCTISFSENIFGDTSTLQKVNDNRTNDPKCEKITCPLFPICMGQQCKKHDASLCDKIIKEQILVLQSGLRKRL